MCVCVCVCVWCVRCALMCCVCIVLCALLCLRWCALVCVCVGVCVGVCQCVCACVFVCVFDFFCQRTCFLPLNNLLRGDFAAANYAIVTKFCRKFAKYHPFICKQKYSCGLHFVTCKCNLDFGRKTRGFYSGPTNNNERKTIPR